MKTDEISRELPCKNMISSHVKITCCLHLKRSAMICLHTINCAFRSKSEIIWYSIAYIINRTLHGHLEIQNFSLGLIWKLPASHTITALSRLYRVRRIQNCGAEFVSAFTDLTLTLTYLKLGSRLCADLSHFCTRTPQYQRSTHFLCGVRLHQLSWFWFAPPLRLAVTMRAYSFQWSSLQWGLRPRLHWRQVLYCALGLWQLKRKHTSCKSYCSYLFNITWSRLLIFVK